MLKNDPILALFIWLLGSIPVGSHFVYASSHSSAVANPETASVPMILDHNRITVEIEIQVPGGKARRATAWVDTGGTEFTISETLARELGFDLSSSAKAAVPEVRLGGFPLKHEGLFLSVNPGSFSRPGVISECTLPARLFRGLHVVFDYPERRLTVALPGILKPQGEMIPVQVHPDTALFMIEAEMNGEKAQLGLDTGSAGTWVREQWADAWLARHPDWPKLTGSTGSTNFFGFPFETQGRLFLASLQIGSIKTDDPVAALGLAPRLFDWYSDKSAASVSGFLGGELLSRYRLEVDLSAGKSWWQAGPPRIWRDLDIVPITLWAEADGTFAVSGIVKGGDQPLVDDLQPGDKLLAVGDLDCASASMGTVIEALRGAPGELRVLRLQREGKQVTVRAMVRRLLDFISIKRKTFRIIE